MKYTYTYVSSNPAQNIQLDEAQEERLLKIITEADNKTFNDYITKNKIDPYYRLRDGKTVLSHTISHAEKELRLSVTVCKQLKQNQDDLQKIAGTIEGRCDNIQNPTRKYAGALFSSQTFLEKLNIPREKWPDKVLTKTVFKDAYLANKEITQAGQNLLDAAKNAKDFYIKAQQQSLIPADIKLAYDNLQKTSRDFVQEKGNFYGLKDTLEKISDFEKDAKKSPSAKEFISLAQDANVQEACPWIKDYKPAEKEFLDTFDPDWQKKQDVLQRLHDIRSEAGNIVSPNKYSDNRDGRERDIERDKENVQKNNDNDDQQKQRSRQEEEKAAKHLQDTDFYNWQKDRLTPERIEFFREIQLEKIKKQQEHIRNRNKDRGMDMER